MGKILGMVCLLFMIKLGLVTRRIGLAELRDFLMFVLESGKNYGDGRPGIVSSCIMDCLCTIRMLWSS